MSNDSEAAKVAAWWKRGVLYQIYPRSFQDSDGDGVGDLKGISDRLPYLSWLGVDAVWLSPIYPSPMADFGYDVSDYCGIDPIFGAFADFDALVESAHRVGVKVILDFVPNHSSNQHPWFVESRNRVRRRKETGTSGRTPSPTAARRTTGSPISAAARGLSTRRRDNITITPSSSSSRISTGAIPMCARRCTMRFVSGSIAGSTAFAST